MGSGDGRPAGQTGEVTRRDELTVFLTTTFVIIPGLAVGFVGAYGFAIWIAQMFLGPPGPPS